MNVIYVRDLSSDEGKLVEQVLLLYIDYTFTLSLVLYSSVTSVNVFNLCTDAGHATCHTVSVNLVLMFAALVVLVVGVTLCNLLCSVQIVCLIGNVFDWKRV